MDIYRGASVIMKVRPDEGDKCTKKVMGENTVNLTVRLSSPFAFQVGDYVMFAGEKYTLNILPKVKKEDAFTFVYDLMLEGVEYELRKVHMLFYTANLAYGGGADFSLMGNAELHARVIVENLNRVQSGWTLDECIITEAKNITYSGNNCLEAITRIAEEFGTEYWIGADKAINIGKRGDLLAVNFQYGKNKGLYGIERTNVNSKDIVTRLYPFGSEQNLPKGYRNNSKRLQIEGAYIEANTSLYGIIESSQTFEEIKPERVGTVTGVEGNVLNFSDSSMDFDLNASDANGTLYLIPGTTAKISFLTGDLAGYEFELASYSHSNKTFRLIKFTDEVAYDLPNDTLKPRVGDKYIILDIYMPATYVADAEARLLAKAQESLAQNSVPNVAYKVEADPLFIKKLGLTYRAGDYVHIEDNDIGVDRDIRIVGIERNLVNDDMYDFELADTVEPSLASQIITQLENQDIVIKLNNLKDPARARRNYKVVQELQNAIFDQDGYFDSTNIKPLSIETGMLSVGSKWNQFYIDTLFKANHLGSANNFYCDSGTLVHLSISEGRNTWPITGLSETIPDNYLRYIYAQCHKDDAEGHIIITDEQMPVDSGSDYWFFLVGVLSSVIDGARQFSPLFGFTTINGRFIKTGRVESADGATYFDLDSNEIGGRINFKDGLVSGLVGVGPNEEAITAGISGAGDTDESIRIWAGATYANRANAPFRIQQNGNGSISGWGIDANRIFKQDGNYCIELNSVDKVLRFTDSEVEKVAISGDYLPSLTSLITPAGGTFYPGANNTTQGGTFSYLAPTSFTITASRVTLKTRIYTADRGFYINITAWLATTAGVKVSKIGTLVVFAQEQDQGLGVDYTWTVSANAVGGTYKVLYEYEVTPDDYGTVTLGGSLPANNTITYSETRTATLIGRNGFASYWTSSRYFYLNQGSSYFLEGRGKFLWRTESISSRMLYVGWDQIQLLGLPTRSTETVYRLYVDAAGTIYKRSTAGE